MRRPRGLTRLSIVAATCLLGTPLAALAQGVATADTAAAAPGATPAVAAPVMAPDAALDETRDLIKSGQYDRAIEELKGILAKEPGHFALLRDAYLLLIKTYVFLGNDYKLKPQGREVSNLNYKAARELIAECLRVKELRHTRPEPASEYPPEMVAFFADVRAELFGAFTVTALDPPSAVVLLDADTLRVPSGADRPGDVDLAVGKHTVVVRARRYQDLSQEITISPGATLEQSYRLERTRGPLWYVTRGGAAAGVTGVVVALTKRHPKTESPLPTAPPPPAE